MLSMNRKSILVLFLAMLMVFAIGCANIGSDPIEQNPTENPLTASSEPPTGTDAPDGSEDRHGYGHAQLRHSHGAGRCDCQGIGDAYRDL